MNKAQRNKLYKRFQLNPKTAKPGDLLAKAKKFKKFPMANAQSTRMTARAQTGIRLQKPLNSYAQSDYLGDIKPSNIGLRNSPTLKKSKKKWTEKRDDTYDRKHGIKENSKTDKALDAKRGLKHKTMCKRCGKSHLGKHKTHKKNWIQNAIKKPGALHRQLGVKQGQKIPTSKLRAAAKRGGTLGRRARLAETLKGFH